MLAFLKEDIEKSKENVSKLCTQDGLQQPPFYPHMLSRRPTLLNWCYARICQNEWWRAHRQPPATGTSIVTSDLLHNIMPENGSSSDERLVNRDL